MKKQEGAVALNETDAGRDKILHIKCDVIKFIRDQMNNIKSKSTRGVTKPSITEASGSSVTKGEQKEKRPGDNWAYMQCLTLCFLLFLLFLYGAFIGANICQPKMHACPPLFPGLGLGQKSHHVIF